MESKNMYDVVIVGGGPAGLTAALYLARARYRVVVVEKEKFGGQITITEEVVNYPGVAKTSGKALAETMRWQAESFGAEFLLAEVTSLDVEGDVKTVRTSRGDLHAFGVLLATGAHPRRVGFAGESEFQGRGVAYCATCDGEFFAGKDVFVIGGGFAAAEESVFLTKYARRVIILMRGDDFSCAEGAAEAARANPKIVIMPNIEVVEVGGARSLEYLRYRNNKTGEVGEYHAPAGDTFGVFVLAGYEPATALLKGVAEVNSGGYAVVDACQQTTAPGLYAAGDVCAKSLRQVVTATGEGALAATELERYAAAMQKKTGLLPERPSSAGVGAAGVGAADGAAAGGAAGSAPGADGSSDAAANLPSSAGVGGDADTAGARGSAGSSGAASAGQVGSRYLDPAMKPQLDAVFERMTSKLVLELHLDDRPISVELRGWMEELASYTEKLSVRVAATGDSAAGAKDAAPCVRILREGGFDTGLAFHGVPGGHEFTSFVLGLYNAAGPGQPLDDDTRERIAAVEGPVRMEVLVSLSCTNCPDVVVAAQRIAAGNPDVSADVYDINHFPAFKDRYNVMSVPCLVINGGSAGEQVAFGKKGIAQVLDLLG